MNILGIETSCDETAASVVKDGTTILSNIVASSVEMHTKTGGIIPEQAARQQVKSISPVIKEALKPVFPKSRKAPDIDVIATTVGPGLIGSLLVGVETAKTLSYLWSIPIIPVNHLVGHIYANFLVDNKTLPSFPVLALVVSGGHTDLVLMKDHGKIRWIGGTRDDAAGEVFDKTARLLGLNYPGGPAISHESSKYFSRNSKPNLKQFPRPMINDDSYDWSFSGLKTAVLNKTKSMGELNIPEYSAEVQEAIVDVLVVKTLRATKKFKPKSLLLAGGVAANKRLKERFRSEIKKQKIKVDFRVPPPKFCTDNAAYIASAAFFNYNPVSWKGLSANPGLGIV